MQQDTGLLRYATLVRTELGKPLVFAGIAAGPVDVEAIPNFTGDADRIEVWLSYAADAGHLRHLRPGPRESRRSVRVFR